MVKTLFQSGTKVTSIFLNAIQNLVFNKNPGEELNDGEYYRLGNDSLLDEPGHIVNDFYRKDGQLQVEKVSGLVISVNGGRYVGRDSLPVGISGGNLTLVDNSINYVFINQNNQVDSDLEVPYISLPLARVTTVNGEVDVIYNARTRNKVFITPSITKVLGGSGEQGDLVTTNNYVFNQGVYYLNSLLIPAGVNTTVKKFTKMYVAGDVIIDGLINIEFAAPGGVGAGTNTLAGLNYGFFPGSGIGASRSLPDNTYHWGVSPIGSGGSTGVVTAVDADEGGGVGIPGGGHGGGGLYIEASGNIVVNGSIIANGGDGANAFGVGVNSLATGGGGGSGGSIVLISNKRITIGDLAFLQANGGNGGDGAVGAGVNSAIAGGGGGGGGGHIECFAKQYTISNDATVEVKGGNQGLTSQGTTDRSSGAVVGGGHGGSFCAAGGNGSDPNIVNNEGEDGQLITRNFVPVA